MRRTDEISVPTAANHKICTNLTIYTNFMICKSPDKEDCTDTAAVFFGKCVFPEALFRGIFFLFCFCEGRRAFVMNNGKNNKTKKLATVSMFCALAYICVFIFRFKVMFLTFDVKDAIITIGAMFCGPVSALVISFVVSLLEMLTVSDTELYGLIMNILSSVAFSFTASLIYKYKKNINGAIIGLFSGVVAMTGIMLAANLVITPFYMGVKVAEVVKMIPSLFLPFNFTKALLNMAIVLMIYKPISSALKKSGLAEGDSSYKFNKKSVLMLSLGTVLLVISLVLFIFVLNGKITLF